MMRNAVPPHRAVIGALAAAALICPLAPSAQNFPAKPVRYVVPFGAGTSPDIVGRLMADRLTRIWGQQVIVDNRVGVAGVMGTAAVAKSPPDGYTLLQCNVASSAIAMSLMSNLPATVQPVQSGRLRALAVTSAQRTPQMPTVPTVAESGFPGYEVQSWYGVCVAAGTPAPLLDKLNADITTVLRAPDVQQRLTEFGIDVAASSREDFDQFIRVEIARWAQVIKDAKIPLQ